MTGKSPRGRARRRRGGTARGREELGADVHVQPAQGAAASGTAARRSHPPPRAGRPRTSSPRARCGTRRGGCRPRTPGVTRSSTSWRARGPAAARRSASWRVERDRPDPGGHRLLGAPGAALGVAVHHDALRVEAGGQRHEELAARGDVAASPPWRRPGRPPSRERPWRRTSRRRARRGGRPAPCGRRGPGRAGRPRPRRRPACRTRRRLPRRSRRSRGPRVR